MFDCSKEILAFHDKHVRLSQADQDTLRKHRNANRDRVRTGQLKNEDPAPREFVSQGSYAMYTINQQADEDYDIDDGVVFSKDDLVGSKGGEMSPLDVRKMVRDAVSDRSFATPPEVKNNCVRVHYAEGHHVDIPVYRLCVDWDDSEFFELASSSWRVSDPKAVTKWFNEAVIEKSPDESNGRQMRRVVRLLKSFAKSRTSWNMPSGFILSVLVNEGYHPVRSRDDEAFVETIRNVFARLNLSLSVEHPVVDEMLTMSHQDPCMLELRDRLGQAIDDLSILDDPDCTPKSALKAWKNVFTHSFFDDVLTDDDGKAYAFSIGSAAPTEPFDKRGGGMYG